jgi:ABC-type uncharacterized transport system permease subunit
MDLLWLRVATFLYATAAVAVFPAVFFGKDRWRRICIHLGGMAWFFHFISLIEMMIAAHHWMPVGAREVESLLGFLFASLFFVVWRFYEAISLGIFALPLTFFLVFVPALGRSGFTFPSSGVRVGWLIVHILALLLAYAALMLSLFSSLLYLVQENRLKSKFKPGHEHRWVSLDWLPPLDTLERVALVTLEFGFPCMSIGLLIGSVLAQETPLGASYFLDAKVIASFLSWGVYVLLLFVRRIAGLRGRRAAYVSGGVLVVMLAVWAANFFSHVHRFGLQ